jgi:hypothetical protein
VEEPAAGEPSMNKPGPCCKKDDNDKQGNSRAGARNVSGCDRLIHKVYIAYLSVISRS